MAISQATRLKAARLLALGKPCSAADVYRSEINRGAVVTDADRELELMALVLMAGDESNS